MRCCEACGNSKIEVILDDLSHKYTSDGQSMTWQYRLLECKSCGLGFIDPKPDWDLLQTFYSSEYGCYDCFKATPEGEANSSKYKIAMLRFATYFSKGPKAVIKTSLGMIAELMSGKTVTYSLGIPLSLSKDAYIFEIGYGSGNWLLAMSQLGWHNLYGYDISTNSENKHRLLEAGINVSSNVFLKNEYPDAFFDCIRLEHVFEHLLEPIEVLEKCRSMLKPGGYLVMNFPCKESLSFKMSPIHWDALEKPRHLYHHTESSASHMLQKAGFTVKSLKAYPVSLVFGVTINNILKEKNIRLPIKMFVLLAPIYKVISDVSRNGEYITVLATR